MTGNQLSVQKLITRAEILSVQWCYLLFI